MGLREPSNRTWSAPEGHLRWNFGALRRSWYIQLHGFSYASVGRLHSLLWKHRGRRLMEQGDGCGILNSNTHRGITTKTAPVDPRRYQGLAQGRLAAGYSLRKGTVTTL